MAEEFEHIRDPWIRWLTKETVQLQDPIFRRLAEQITQFLSPQILGQYLRKKLFNAVSNLLYNHFGPNLERLY